MPSSIQSISSNSFIDYQILRDKRHLPPNISCLSNNSNISGIHKNHLSGSRTPTPPDVGVLILCCLIDARLLKYNRASIRQQRGIGGISGGGRNPFCVIRLVCLYELHRNCLEPCRSERALRGLRINSTSEDSRIHMNLGAATGESSPDANQVKRFYEQVYCAP